MEPGEGPLLQSEPPGVNTLRSAEVENSDHPPTTEMLESCLPDKIEAAKPPCPVEEIMEIPDTRGSSPVSSRVPHALLGGFHENEPKSEACGFGAAGSSSLPRFLWGEQMSEFSDPLSCSSGTNGASKPPRYGKGRLSNSSSSCSTEKFMSTFASLELKTETPAASILNGITELLRWGSRKPESVTSDAGTTSDVKPSLQDGGKLKSVRASKLGLTEENDDDDAVLAMFSAVANSHLPVQSQQKDEPDFTPAQKLAILRDLYHTKPLVFLERFRTVLCEEHLACFRHLSGNYEADFYCAEVRRAGVGKNRHTRVRNKRYAALQQLIRGGEYFSDEQMRSRDPLLYKQYIGQYLSHEELQALESCKKETSCSLSGVLLDSYQEDVIQRRLQVQQEQEEAAEEEEEDSSSEDDEDKASDDDMDEWAPDQEEKAILREEFTSRMYQRFLDGKDRDFDYSEVDENPDFDNLDIVSRDEEERYFDEDEEEEADAMEAE